MCVCVWVRNCIVRKWLEIKYELKKSFFKCGKRREKVFFLFGFLAFIPFMISIEFSFTMWIVYSGNGLWNNNNKALFMLGEILFLPYIPIDFCCNAIRCLFIIQPSRLIELNEIAILGVFLFMSLWKDMHCSEYFCCFWWNCN